MAKLLQFRRLIGSMLLSIGCTGVAACGDSDAPGDSDDGQGEGPTGGRYPNESGGTGGGKPGDTPSGGARASGGSSPEAMGGEGPAAGGANTDGSGGTMGSGGEASGGESSSSGGQLGNGGVPGAGGEVNIGGMGGALVCIDATDCDFASYAADLFPNGEPECRFSVKEWDEVLLGIEIGHAAIYYTWTPPEGEEHLTATASFTLDGTFSLYGSQVSTEVGEGLSTAGPIEVTPGSGRWGSEPGDPYSYGDITGTWVEMELQVGDRTVSCVDSSNRPIYYLGGYGPRILEEVDTPCGWGLVVGVSEPQSTLYVENLGGDFPDFANLPNRWDSPGGFLVAGADFPGSGPWKLGTRLIEKAPVHDPACFLSLVPDEAGTWAAACAENPPPVFPGEAQKGCPAGCEPSIGAIDDYTYPTCYCDFEATWVEAVQHCRSANSHLTTTDGDYVPSSGWYPWAMPAAGIDHVNECTDFTPPDQPLQCKYFTIREIYTADGYYEWERDAKVTDCLEKRTFHCEVSLGTLVRADTSIALPSGEIVSLESEVLAEYVGFYSTKYYEISGGDFQMKFEGDIESRVPLEATESDDFNYFFFSYTNDDQTWTCTTNTPSSVENVIVKIDTLETWGEVETNQYRVDEAHGTITAECPYIGSGEDPGPIFVDIVY